MGLAEKMRKILSVLLLYVASSAISFAEVKTVITDGERPFAEGSLEGYFVQADGRTVCSNPYVIGKYISCSKSISVAGQVWTAPPGIVWAETNGILGAMVVVDASGRVLCDSPMVSVQFRGPESYIICGN